MFRNESIDGVRKKTGNFDRISCMNAHYKHYSLGLMCFSNGPTVPIKFLKNDLFR